MSLDILREKGVPLENQKFTWKELADRPTASWTTMHSRASG